MLKEKQHHREQATKVGSAATVGLWAHRIGLPTLLLQQSPVSLTTEAAMAAVVQQGCNSRRKKQRSWSPIQRIYFSSGHVEYLLSHRHLHFTAYVIVVQIAVRVSSNSFDFASVSSFHFTAARASLPVPFRSPSCLSTYLFINHLLLLPVCFPSFDFVFIMLYSTREACAAAALALGVI